MEPVRPWVEIEDLPTQSLGTRRTARVPLTGALAAAAIVVLLAGGFGLLGGRSAGTPVAPPPASPVADQPSVEGSVTESPPVPRVTPSAACAGPPDEPPAPVLEVEGRQYLGQVESLDFDLGQSFDASPAVIGEDELLDVVELPMDASTDIWIVGGACAVAWDIDLVAPTGPTRDSQTLENVPNEDRDPAVAAQNRFQVFVAPYAGDHLLRAAFLFEDFAVRATWSIHVPPPEPPGVTLTGATHGDIPTVIGCDATERLVNDIEVPLSQCARDVRREPARRVEVAPGEALEFSIDGWAASIRSVSCGQLTDRTFVPRTEPSCVRTQDPVFAGVRFPAPEEAGRWTLAISTCAARIRVTGTGFEALCGTWYVNVLVRG